MIQYRANIKIEIDIQRLEIFDALSSPIISIRSVSVLMKW